MRARHTSTRSFLCIASLALIAIIGTVRGYGAASPGQLDATFGVNGQITFAIANADGFDAVVVSPDGRIVLAGRSGNDLAVTRLLPNGTFDPTFGTGGTALLSPAGGADSYSPRDMALQPDGRIVVAGYSDAGGGVGAYDFLVVRLTSGGQPDPTFSGDGFQYVDFGFDDRAAGVALQDDGGIVLAGSVNYGSSSDFAVARLSSTGALDATFDSDGRRTLAFNGDDIATGVAIDSEGRAVVVGSTEWDDIQQTTHTDVAVVRFTAAGALDGSFGDGGTGKRRLDVVTTNTSDVAIQPDGAIVVGGTDANGHVTVTRLAGTNGALDATFSGDGTAVVQTSDNHYNDRAGRLAILHNGKIAIVATVLAGGAADTQVAVFARDGSPDSTFDGDGIATINFGGSDSARALALQPDGGLVVAGSTDFGAVGASKPRVFAVARLRADAPVDVTFDADGRQKTTFSLINADEGHAVAVDPQGRTLVAGISGGPNANFAVGRYTPTGALDTTFSGDGRQTVDFGGADLASAMVRQPDGRLVIVGYTNRTAAGAAAAPGDYNIAVTRLTVDGVLDTTFNDLVSPSTSNGDGRAVIDLGANDRATSVALQADGKILVAGSTTLVNAEFAIARLLPDGTLDTTFSGDGVATFGFNGNDYATSIAVQPDGRILVAGYSDASGSDDFAILRLTATGQLDTTFNDVASPTASVGDGRQLISFGSSIDRAQAMVLQADGRIVLAGSWDGGLSDFAVARLTSAGLLDTTFGVVNGAQRTGKVTFTFGAQSFGGQEFAQCIALAPGGQLVVGGYSDAGSGLGANDFALAVLDTHGDEVDTFANGGELLLDFGGDDRAFGCAIDPATSRVLAVGRSSAGDMLAVVRLPDDALPSQPALPTVSIDDLVVTEGAAGTSLAVFTVSLSATPTIPVQVVATTLAGTATAGTDFVPVSAGASFVAGGPTTATIAVPVLGDVVGEADETFSVVLGDVVGATIADGVGVGTIANDDLAIIISSPSSAPTFTASSGLLMLGGTAAASGASPLRDVTWSTAAGASGIAIGTSEWRAGIPLALGTNAITVTARDQAGHAATDSATIVVSGFVSYLAEGATSDFIDTQLALLNTSDVTTTATLTFSPVAAPVVQRAVPVPAKTRVTVHPRAVAGLSSAEFSTRIESDVPLVADRTMRWDASGYGGHAETAIAAPSPTWYLAEGATHSGFDLFYLLQNPGNAPTTARVRYLRPTGAPIEKDYVLPPTSRTNIWVDVEQFDGLGPALASTDVSAVITTLDSTPIIVERALYLSNQGRVFNAGHESAGVTSPSTSWFLAEGATGPYFDLFVLIANPGDAAADVRLTYLLTDGRTFTRTMTAPPNSRSNVWVDTESFDGGQTFPLADVAVSTTVTSLNDVPVIVERALWWPGDFATWHEAHNSAGATQTGTSWALAEGEVAAAGDASAEETYVLIANTSAFAGTARVTLYFEDGSQASRDYVLAPRSRTNVAVGPDFGADVVGRRFGTVVESLGDTPAQIVVERAMYWNAGGVTWAAGTNALATRLR